MPFGDAGGQPPPWQQAADRLGHILGGAGASSQLSEKKRCGVQEGPGAPAALRRGDGKSGVSAKDLHRGQRGLEARLSRSKEFGGNLFSGDDRKDSSRAATAPAEAESKPEDGLAKALGSLGAASQRFVAGVAGSLPFSPGSERCKGQGREEATTTAAVHIAERRGRQPSSSHQKRASTSAVPDDLSVNVDSFMNGEAKPWDVLGELLKGRERHHSGQALVSTPQDQLPDMTTDVWRGEHLFARISDFPENVAHAMLPRGAVGAAPDQRTSNNNSSRHQVGKGRGRDSGRDVSVTGPQTQPAEVPLVSGMKGLFGRIGDISDSLGKPPAAVKEDIAPNQGLSPRAPAAAPAPSKPARQNLIGRISELSEEISKRTPRSREQPEARASTPPPGDAMAFQSPLGSAGRQQLLERISENLGMATPKTKEAGPTVTTPQNIGPGSGPSGPAQEFPDTPLRSLPPIRTSPKPPGPPDVAAVTTGVLKSIDSLYSEGVAKPVGTLIGPGVEKLQATLQQMSVKELVEGLQKLALARKGGEEGKRPVYPNRQRLSSVQDFFLYAEAEGRRLFDELDFDGDGQVTLPDLEHAMRKRRLPKHYAREMLRRARPHWLASSFGWPEFQALMEQKEPSMLKAFTSLSVSSSGTLQKGQVSTLPSLCIPGCTALNPPGTPHLFAAALLLFLLVLHGHPAAIPAPRSLWLTLWWISLSFMAGAGLPVQSRPASNRGERAGHDEVPRCRWGPRAGHLWAVPELPAAAATRAPVNCRSQVTYCLSLCIMMVSPSLLAVQPGMCTVPQYPCSLVPA